MSSSTLEIAIFSLMSLQCNLPSSLAYRIKDLMQTFMNETIGTTSLGSTGFSFADSASTLANDLINSLVVDIAVDLDVSFGLNLAPVFDTSSAPVPFIMINQFNFSGAVGVNEWSSTLPIGNLEVSISQARALVEASATLKSPPLLIRSADDLTGLFNNASAVDVTASLDVVFPIFITTAGIGFGAQVKYMDPNLLDNEFPAVTIDADVLIAIAQIKAAAELLRNSTAFLSDFDPVSTNLPLVETTVNGLVAGPDRTLADLFDLTDWASNLKGTAENVSHSFGSDFSQCCNV